MEPTELAKAYRPIEHEDRIRGRWMAAKAFTCDPQRVIDGKAEPYSILIPPPNVTARLHLGHALNNTLQDVLIRAHRMMGFETLWMVGTDHAGIATQAIVERRLWEEEKLRKHDLGREAFVARVQAWKDDYETQITDQLKLMGCSCDFDRQRFTMDEVCAKAVREAFFRLFRDGLIYRGKRLVNWDPALQTAVADDECFDEEIDTSFWYLRYPIVHGGPALQAGSEGGSVLRAGSEGEKPGSENRAIVVTWDELARRGYPGAEQHPADEPAWVTVATTRPETYLADTAVAINPHDPRATALRGLCVLLPLVGRVIPIVEDSYVVLPEAMARNEEEKNDPKAKFATGFLKVTPGHDKNDWELGQRHKLDVINMMSPEGRVSDKHGWMDVGDAHLFVGLTMAEARKKVVGEFKSHGLLEAVKPYKQSVAFSDRSKAQVEPYLSDQWYVRVTDPRMAASANAALVADQQSHQSPQRKQGLASGEAAAHTVDRAPTLACASGSEGRGDGGVRAPKMWYLAPFWHAGGEPAGENNLHDQPKVLGETIAKLEHFFSTLGVDATIRTEGNETASWISLSTNSTRFEAMAQLCDLLVTPVGGDPAKVAAAVRALPFPVRDVDAVLTSIDEIMGLFDSNVKSMFGWERVPGQHNTQAAHRTPAPPAGAEGSEGGSSKGSGDGAMRFYPARYAKTFEQWHDNIRDWCISRQLWWGHRIPVWTCSVSTFESREHDEPGSSYLEFVDRGIAELCRFLDASGVLDQVDIKKNADVDARQEISRVFWACARSERASRCLTLLERYKRARKEANRNNVAAAAIHAEISSEFPGARNAMNFTGFASLAHDPDVLDTWFSSALWPLSTMGWPSPTAETKGLLEAFNPSSTLCTAREIITLWVSRMTMFNRYFTEPRALASEGARAAVEVDTALADARGSVGSSGVVPFRDVFIHAVIQDGEGQKMSKSLGNGVDPIDIIETHGSDAMRFTLCTMSTHTQDVRLPVDLICPHTGEVFAPKMVTNKDGYRVPAAVQESPKDKSKKMVTAYGVASGEVKATPEMPLAKNTSGKFDLGRNFANKLWNASRFAFSILDKNKPEGEAPDQHSDWSGVSVVDRWMVSRLATATKEMGKALESFEFSTYAQTLYDVVWRDFCDWYLEAIKPTVAADPRQRAVLHSALAVILRLAHPVMPFITEVIYERLREVGMNAGELPWLGYGASIHMGKVTSEGLLCHAGWPRVSSDAVSAEGEAAFAHVQALVTAIREVRAQHNVQPKRKVTLNFPASIGAFVTLNQTLIGTLAGVDAFAVASAATNDGVSFAFDGLRLRVTNLADAVDAGAEWARLTKQVADLEKSAATFEGRLANPGYADRAPPAMVQQTRDQLAKAKNDLAAAQESLAKLA